MSLIRQVFIVYLRTIHTISPLPQLEQCIEVQENYPILVHVKAVIVHHIMKKTSPITIKLLIPLVAG